jgi:8-oxo-dGTP pyrophosphatase MutT (NUDIX family)
MLERASSIVPRGRLTKPRPRRGSVADVGSPDETVSLVDETGAVTGAAPRSDVRRANLLHAATAVLVRHPDGRIYVSRRAADKDWSPSSYDAAAGGIVQHGEPVEESAYRELAEELGIEDVPLRFLLTGRYDDDTVRCFVHCFETTYDGVVTHADGEVVWGDWVSLPELGRRLRDPDWPFVPDTRSLLERLARDEIGDYDQLGLDPAAEEAT